MGLLGIALGAALGVGTATVAIPAVVGLAGFTAAGVAAGSVASSNDVSSGGSQMGAQWLLDLRWLFYSQ
uniref:Uncharacterized protein n=1 Tax=Anguilla anguilla TaxID=7936 RepID=A0A0E9SQK1_ANGAN